MCVVIFPKFMPEQVTCEVSIVFPRIIIIRGASPRGPPRTSGARNPIVIVKIFRAQVGNLQGPYCFSKDSLLGPEQGTYKDPIVFQIFFFFFRENDCIFHCLDTPQNAPNLEYKSHLAKNVLIYCRSEFPPLGGTVIKESAFWIITLIYFFAHSKPLCPQ